MTCRQIRNTLSVLPAGNTAPLPGSESSDRASGSFFARRAAAGSRAKTGVAGPRPSRDANERRLDQLLIDRPPAPDQGQCSQSRCGQEESGRFRDGRCTAAQAYLHHEWAEISAERKAVRVNAVQAAEVVFAGDAGSSQSARIIPLGGCPEERIRIIRYQTDPIPRVGVEIYDLRQREVIQGRGSRQARIVDGSEGSHKTARVDVRVGVETDRKGAQQTGSPETQLQLEVAHLSGIRAGRE